jgi:hypothetical protein
LDKKIPRAVHRDRSGFLFLLPIPKADNLHRFYFVFVDEAADGVESDPKLFVILSFQYFQLQA